MILGLVYLLFLVLLIVVIVSLYLESWLCTVYSFLLVHLGSFCAWYDTHVSYSGLSYFGQTYRLFLFSKVVVHVSICNQILSSQVQLRTQL